MLRILGLALLVHALGEALLARLTRRDPTPAAGETPRPWSARNETRMDVAVAAWAAAGVLALLAGVAPRLGLEGEIGQREGVLTTLALAGLYAGARRSHPGPKDARRTLDVVLACAALTAAYAVLQSAGLDPLRWISALSYPAGATAVRRAFGTLGNPILLGGLLAAALAAGVARLACARGLPWRLAAPVVLITCAAAATLSRGAWLAALAGIAAAVAGALALRRAHAARRAGLALAVVTVPSALWLVIALRAPIAARLGETAGAVSGAARVEIARGALALWRRHPWLGTGPDSFGLMFPTVQTAGFWRTEWLGIPVHAHSAALQALATLGALGALAGLAWLACLAWALSGGARAASLEAGERVALGAAAIALVVAGAFNPVGLAGAACLAVFSALAVGGEEPGSASRPSRARMEAAARQHRTVRFVARAACFATAAVTTVFAAREMSALAAAGIARSALERAVGAPALERGNLSAVAVRQSLVATSKAPGEDELWRLACDASLALSQAALEQHEVRTAGVAATSAAASAGRAIALAPRRASNYQRLGNALTARARIAVEESIGLEDEIRRGPAIAAIADSADRAFAEAARLAPCDGLILVDQVRDQLMLGRIPQALVSARRIVALYPGAATGHALEAAALIALHRKVEARSALLLARDGRWEDGSESQRKAVEGLIREYANPDSAP